MSSSSSPSSSSSSSSYYVLHISTTSPTFPELAASYSRLRLSALLNSPTAFSSTHAYESRFSAADWESRLSRAGIETFVCIQHTPSSSSSSSTSSIIPPAKTEEWVGSVTLLRTDSPDVWQMAALYTDPEHRGRGLARLLCEATVEFVGEGATIRLMVKRGNTKVTDMYKSIGWVETGVCTLEQALIANGDKELLPADRGGDEKWTLKTGVVMERVVGSRK